VYNTHLDAHYKTYRGYQLGFFARMMAAHNGITIGGGDLNENIGSPAYAPFGRRGLSQIGPSGDVCNAHPGGTIRNSRLCVDMIWGDANVTRSGNADIIEEMNPDDSDHWPIKMNIRIR
jgi:endonuclease/exonuclease/phosphatase family metal-dependent hydrolase